ncbi:MAG TPA: SRPBCC family protein [Actinomycetota bacterium]|nr:SRPBCC family protein [Actinomycetota bacterium]
MARVRGSIQIDRPVEEVYSFAVRPENVPLWSAVPLQARKTSEGPVGIGTTASFVNTFLGRRVKADFEVIEFEPNVRFCSRTTSAPFPVRNTMTFERVGAGTRMTQTIEAESGGFFRVAEPVLHLVGERELRKSLANLKDLLERGPSP